MRKRFTHWSQTAFALPSVVLVSVVMLTVLLAVLSGVSSSTSALNNQYYQQLAREAAESGMVLAEACMAANGNTITWTNATPLKPNTDCKGTETFNCPDSSTAIACYVSEDSNYHTTFRVGVVTDANGNSTSVSSQGVTQQILASGGVISRSTSSLKMRINPFLALASVGATKNLVSLSPGVSLGNLVTGTRLCGLTDSGQVWCAGSMDESFTNGYSRFSYPDGTASTDIGFFGGTPTCYAVFGSVRSTVPCGDSAPLNNNSTYLTNLSDSVNGIFKGKTIKNPGTSSSRSLFKGFILY